MAFCIVLLYMEAKSWRQRLSHHQGVGAARAWAQRRPNSQQQITAATDRVVGQQCQQTRPVNSRLEPHSITDGRHGGARDTAHRPPRPRRAGSPIARPCRSRPPIAAHAAARALQPPAHPHTKPPAPPRRSCLAPATHRPCPCRSHPASARCSRLVAPLATASAHAWRQGSHRLRAA